MNFGESFNGETMREYKGKSLVDLVDNYTVIDIETTGYDPNFNQIIEVGALRIRQNQIVDSFGEIINVGEIPSYIEDLTGITNSDIANGKPRRDVLNRFYQFVGNDILIGHNVNFDINFLYDNLLEYGIILTNNFVDTMRISKKVLPQLDHHRLVDLVHYYKIVQEKAHRAVSDCESTYKLFTELKKDAINIFGNLNNYENSWKKQHSHYSSNIIDIPPEWSAALQSYVPECTNSVYGNVFCFTGTLKKMNRSTAFKIVEILGGSISKSVTYSTDYLVMGTTDYQKTVDGGDSNKTKKAKQLSLNGNPVEMISENVFYSMIDDALSQTPDQTISDFEITNNSQAVFPQTNNVSHTDHKNAETLSNSDTLFENITHSNRGDCYNFPQFYVIVNVTTNTNDTNDSQTRNAELSALKVENGKIVDSLISLIALQNSDLNSCCFSLVNFSEAKRTFNAFLQFINNDIIIGYDITRQLKFIDSSCKHFKIPKLNNKYIDVMYTAKHFVKSPTDYNLKTICESIKIATPEQISGITMCNVIKKVFDYIFCIVINKNKKMRSFPKQINEYTLQYLFRDIPLTQCNKEKVINAIKHHEQTLTIINNEDIAICSGSNRETIALIPTKVSTNTVCNMIKKWNSLHFPYTLKLHKSKDDFCAEIAFYMSDTAIIDHCEFYECTLIEFKDKDAQFGINHLAQNQTLHFHESSGYIFNNKYKIGKISPIDIECLQKKSKYGYGSDRILRLVKFAGLENGAPKVKIYYK